MRRIGIVWISVLALATIGCEYRDAVRLAKVSQATYDQVSDPVVAEIVRLVKQSEVAPLAETDRQWLGELNAFRPKLDTFAATHNLYVDSLAVWKLTNSKPSNLQERTTPLIEFVRDGQKLWLTLKNLRR